MAFGREVEPGTATALVHAFLDRGLTLIDTADSYADGRAEEIVGAAIRGRRDRVVLSGKAGLPLYPGPDRTRASRRHLRLAVQGSLRRLGTDHIDLFHLHRWDDGAPVEETLSTLDDMVRAGAIGYVAVSNFTGWQLAWTRTVALRYGWQPPVAVQARYSLAARDVEREILPYCRFAGLAFVASSPLAGGILTGKYRAGEPYPAGSRATRPDIGRSLRSRLGPATDALTDTLRRLAADCGATPGQLALAWLRGRRGVASTVVGAVDAGQLTEALDGLALRVPGAVLDELDAASARPQGYPYELLRELGCAGEEVR